MRGVAPLSGGASASAVPTALGCGSPRGHCTPPSQEGLGHEARELGGT